ncbi:MAG: phage tail tape measure protein [Bacteroidota bacterium]
MGDFSEEFKVSIIADASDIQQKTSDATAKLKAFTDKANQNAQIRLRVSIAELENSLADARKRLSDFRKEGDKNGEIKTRLEISGLQQNKTQASKLLRDLQSDVNDTGKSFFSLNSIVGDALKAFGAFFLIRKVADGLRDALDASVSFESAFAGIKKTVDASDAEFGQLSDQIIELSKNIPVTVEALSHIGELGGQLGVKKGDIIDFTKTIAAIGVSTNLTTEEAATSFAKISNIFQEPIAKVSNLASSVVALGNNSATTESQIVDFTTQIAAAGKLSGLSQADVAGISAAFSSVGIDAAAGGTAVSKTLQSISDAVNKGGKDLNGFASVSGLTGKKFTELWRSSPVQAFEAFVSGLGKSGQKGSAILDDLVGSDVRLKKAFLSVANAGDLLGRSVDLSNKAFVENTALTEEANKRYETTESKLQDIDNRFTALKISFGNFLKEVAVPVLNFFVTLAEALGGASNDLSGLASVVKTLGIIITTSLSIGTIKKVFGVLDTALGGVAGSFKVASAAGGLMPGIFGAIETAAAALVSPMGILTAAITAVSFVVFSAIDAENKLQTATKNLKAVLNDGIKFPTLDALNKQFQEIIDKTHETGKALDGFAARQALGVAGAATSSNPLSQPSPASFGALSQGNAFDSTLQAPGIPNASLGGAGDQQAFQAELAKSATQVALLQTNLIGLLGSAGATKTEITDFTDKLGVFHGANELSAADQELLTQKFKDLAPATLLVADNFENSVQRQVDAGATWEDAIKTSVEANKKQFEANGQNAEEMTQTIEETFVANVAKSGDVGKAAAIAYGAGFGSDQARAAIEKGTGTITDTELLIQLNAAIQSGKNGEAAGLLHALGIGDAANLKAVQKSGKNLNQAVINTFDSATPAIFSSGKNSGSSLVGGIISGISSRVPLLGSILSKITASLGSFASIGQVFAPLASQIPLVGPLISTFSKLGNKSQELKGQLQDLQSAAKNVGGSGGGGGSLPAGGGGGGGGGGKGLDEAKKKAEEAQKAVDDFTKSVEENNKASKKLRDDVTAFYADIISSIDKAKEKQGQLTDEFDKFQTQQNKDFAGDTAKRDAKLAEDLDKAKQDKQDLEAQLQAAKDEFTAKKDKLTADDPTAIIAASNAIQNALDAQQIAQEKYNDAVKTGNQLQIQQAKLTLDKANQAVDKANSGPGNDLTKQQQALADLEIKNAKDVADLQDKINDKDKEINDTLKERKQIEDFLNSLAKDTTDAQKAYDDAVKGGNVSKIAAAKAALDKATADKAEFEAFTESKRRETLTEFEQSQLILSDKVAEKKAEVDAEKAKQQQIIDIQTRFLALQNATSADDLKKKQALADLANNADLLTAEQKQKALSDLGFGNLTVDQQNDLLKQTQKATALDIETKQVEDQQIEILATKQKYQDLAEQYHGESVDKMKAKEQELIDLIQTAQQEQIKLNNLVAAKGKTSSSTTNNSTINVTNNNNSNVDSEANNNNLLNKIK